jgi:hypothetical protein
MDFKLPFEDEDARKKPNSLLEFKKIKWQGLKRSVLMKPYANTNLFP